MRSFHGHNLCVSLLCKALGGLERTVGPRDGVFAEVLMIIVEEVLYHGRQQQFIFGAAILGFVSICPRLSQFVPPGQCFILSSAESFHCSVIEYVCMHTYISYLEWT